MYLQRQSMNTKLEFIKRSLARSKNTQARKTVVKLCLWVLMVIYIVSQHVQSNDYTYHAYIGNVEHKSTYIGLHGSQHMLNVMETSYCADRRKLNNFSIYKDILAVISTFLWGRLVKTYVL